MERFIQSVQRAIDVLELFHASSLELGVTEISEKLELTKSTVHGIIKTLEHRGYLEQNPMNQRYKLGIKLFELGNLVASNMNITKLAIANIHELVAELNETVHLVVLEGSHVIYVEKVEAQSALRMYSQLGKRAPMYCTGVGKAILAFMENQRIEQIISSTELTSFTPHTLVTEQAIKDDLQKIRQRGYALDDEEIELGLRCVAAPIFNHEGKVFASVSCAGPKIRISDEKLDVISQRVKHAALEISKKMGYIDSTK
jgi:IclR family KDG regulon transcriptional repressor